MWKLSRRRYVLILLLCLSFKQVAVATMAIQEPAEDLVSEITQLQKTLAKEVQDEPASFKAEFSKHNVQEKLNLFVIHPQEQAAKWLELRAKEIFGDKSHQHFVEEVVRRWEDSAGSITERKKVFKEIETKLETELNRRTQALNLRLAYRSKEKQLADGAPPPRIRELSRSFRDRWKTERETEKTARDKFKQEWETLWPEKEKKWNQADSVEVIWETVMASYPRMTSIEPDSGYYFGVRFDLSSFVQFRESSGSEPEILCDSPGVIDFIKSGDLAVFLVKGPVIIHRFDSADVKEPIKQYGNDSIAFLTDGSRIVDIIVSPRDQLKLGRFQTILTESDPRVWIPLHVGSPNKSPIRSAAYEVNWNKRVFEHSALLPTAGLEKPTSFKSRD